MNTNRSAGGFTLIELSVVIAVLIALISTGFYSSAAISKWHRGRVASETLRSAYVAQRMYLADYPTTQVSTLTHNRVLPYIPNSPSQFPTVTSLEGATLQIKIDTSPPVINAGDGTAYDPSGNPTDSLWDVGE